MKPDITARGWIVLMERCYSAMLILYPADYRREYGALMRQFFRDVARDRYHRQGVGGVVRWWCKTLLDLVITAMEQRRKMKYAMSKNALTQMMIQITGVLLVIGGICSAIAAFSQLQPGDHYTYEGVYQILNLLFTPGFLFLGLGYMGLALRYNQVLGAAGQGSLYLMSMGSLLMVVGRVIQLTQASLWTIEFAGIVVYGISVIVFGLLFAQKPFLPIFRWLPLQIAFGWLMMFAMTGLFPQFTANLLTFLMAFGAGLAWLAIGLKIHKDEEDSIHSSQPMIVGS